MEQGDLSVALSRYYRAAEVPGMTEGFDQLLVKKESLPMAKARLNACLNSDRLGAVHAADIVISDHL